MKKVVYSILALCLILTLIPTPTADAATIKTVRVALFIDEPSLYSNKTTYVTSGSKSAFHVSLNQSQLLSYEADTKVKVSFNDYKAKLMESSSYNAVSKAHEALKAAGGKGAIVSLQKNDILVYQLLEGSYQTEALAKAAVDTWTKSLGTVLNNTSTIIGPHAYIEGRYSTRNDALQGASHFGKLGLDTAIALQKNDSGQAHYVVVVGMVKSQAELDLVGVLASNAGKELSKVTGEEELVIIRHEHSMSNHPGTFHDLVLFNRNQKLTIKAAEDGTVDLVERANRTYRGVLELGQHNNQLYVVNELAVDQYLYSVVAVEMYTSWPIEALKTQAVASRTFIAQKGMQFKVAHVVDTTLSQVYYGASSETENTRAAVNETSGVIITYNGRPIDAVYSSNAGGQTAKASEVWRNDFPYLQSVSSNDTLAEEGLLDWYKVTTIDGKLGYVRVDNIEATGRQNEAGFPIYRTTTDNVNLRKHPVVQSTIPVVAELANGAELTYISKHIQSNPYRWIRGPYSSDELLVAINKSQGSNFAQEILSLQVASRGESGRAQSIKMNTQTIKPNSGDSIRGLFNVDGSLPSTLLDIEASGSVAILGANGQVKEKNNGSASISIVGAGTQKTSTEPYTYVLNGAGDVRTVTKETSYTFSGTGFGHGVGMSQFGAYQLAKAGYDYQTILKHYYTDVTIGKDE